MQQAALLIDADRTGLLPEAELARIAAAAKTAGIEFRWSLFGGKFRQSLHCRFYETATGALLTEWWARRGTLVNVWEGRTKYRVDNPDDALAHAVDGIRQRRLLEARGREYVHPAGADSTSLRPPLQAALPVVSCPKCGEAMKKRRGPRGHFWGCSAYPSCRATREL